MCVRQTRLTVLLGRTLSHHALLRSHRHADVDVHTLVRSGVHTRVAARTGTYSCLPAQIGHVPITHIYARTHIQR